MQTQLPVDENKLCIQWCQILLDQEVKEVRKFMTLRSYLVLIIVQSLTNVKTNNITSGYARLMICAIEHRRDPNTSLGSRQNWLTAITERLFPTLAPATNDTKQSEIYSGYLASDTRQSLYKLIYLLAEENKDLHRVLTKIMNLLPSGMYCFIESH